MSLKKVLIIVLLALGFLWRLIGVSQTPPGLTMDESAIGYNAYSILKTGKDEYGKSFPLVFRSFTDYKSPVYVYLSVPFIKIMGLNILSLRFLSILSGTLTGLLIYLFVLKLFGSERWLLAISSAGVFLFSGWSVLYSRGGFESNVALLFLVLGVYLQLLAFRENKYRWLVLSSASYAFSAHSYQSEKILAPIFLLALSFFFREKKNTFNLKKNALVFLFFMTLSLPQYLFMKQIAGNTRIVSTASVKKEEITAVLHDPAKAVLLLERSMSLYSAYFSPRNLFFDPDPMKSRTIPEVSTFYPWLVIPYFLGLYLLFSCKEKRLKKILVFLLLTSPVAAAATQDPFASLRALPLIFPLSIIVGLGLDKLMTGLIKTKYVLVPLFLLTVVSFFQLYRGVFCLLPNEKYLDWNYGYAELVKKISQYPDLEVLFDDTIGDNYTEFLFFQKYPPQIFQQEQNKVSLVRYYQDSQWVNTYRFGRIKAMPLRWDRDVYLRQLIVASPLAISEGQTKEHFLTKTFAIIGPDGQTIFNGYLTNPELKRLDDERKLKLKIYETGNF